MGIKAKQLDLLTSQIHEFDSIGTVTANDTSITLNMAALGLDISEAEDQVGLSVATGHNRALVYCKKSGKRLYADNDSAVIGRLTKDGANVKVQLKYIRDGEEVDFTVPTDDALIGDSYVVRALVIKQLKDVDNALERFTLDTIDEIALAQPDQGQHVDFRTVALTATDDQTEFVISPELEEANKDKVVAFTINGVNTQQAVTVDGTTKLVFDPAIAGFKLKATDSIQATYLAKL